MLSSNIDKGHRYSSLDTGGQTNEHISERLPDHQSMEPTKFSDGTIFDVSRGRDINIKPIQASRRRLGMSTNVDPPSCLHNPISYNVTLSHGLRSGHFKDQGRVDDFDVCFRLCCRDDECNLVFMLRSYCYLVSCYDQESCALKPLVSTANRELAVAFVYKEHNKELMDWNRAPMNHVSSLPANYQTNKQFENEPDVTNQNVDQMSGQASQSNPNFESIYQETKPMNPHLANTYSTGKEGSQNPQSSDQIVGNRPFSQTRPPSLDITPETKSTVHYPDDSLSCIPGPERYFTTLQGGLNAGYFTDIGFVSNMQTCKQYCCEKSDCDVALMQQERCYLVTCPRSELCRDVPASFARGITRVSHMFREGRSTVNEGNVIGNREESMRGNRGMYGFGDNHEGIDGISSDVDNRGNGNFHDFGGSHEDMSGIRGNQDIHDIEGIRSYAGNRGNEGMVRDINGVHGKDETYRREGIGNIYHNKRILEDRDTQRSSPIKMERKDTIPVGYEDNRLPSRSSFEADDKDNDEEMNLLRDAIAGIEQKKQLQNEEQFHEMRSTSEIPTPPSQTKTDFEKLFDKDRQDPLIFDDSAGRRKHSSKSEGLGDMASDILSNILKHRTHDSVESIWSNNRDPLQNEITKARETNTPEKIEKELHQSENRKISEEQGHKAMSGVLKAQSLSPEDNARISGASDTTRLDSDLGRQGKSSETNENPDDQSKLIETLYNLVKGNSRTKNDDSVKHRGNYNKQGTVLNKETNDDEIIDTDSPESDMNTAEDEYSDNVDNNDGYSSGNAYNSRLKDTHPKKLSTHFRHAQENRVGLKVNGNDVHYRDNDDDDEIYDTRPEEDGDNVVEERKPSWQSGRQEGKTNGNSEQDVEGSQSREREEKTGGNSYQRLHDRQSAEEQRNTYRLLDQDLAFITDTLGEQELQDRNDYGTNDNSFSDYDDNNLDYSDDLSKINDYDSLGMGRKLLHSQPTNFRKPHSPVNYNIKAKHWQNSAQRHTSPNLSENKVHFLATHSNGRKPLVFLEEKQPLGQENDNLVMNELQKIEDDLSEIKSQPKSEEGISEHTIHKPNSTISKSPNLMEKSKDDRNTKESIVDILANMKDISRPDLNKNVKGQTSNKTSEGNVAKTDDEKLILDQLNEIKDEIGNISKSSDNSGKTKVSPKVDDIGDDISELLGEDWDLDKRSHIPKPSVSEKWARGGSGPVYHDSRMEGVVKIGTGDVTGGNALVKSKIRLN